MDVFKYLKICIVRKNPFYNSLIYTFSNVCCGVATTISKVTSAALVETQLYSPHKDPPLV